MAQQQKFDPTELAAANVSTAVDQQQAHASLAEALDIYFENLRDTLVEYRATGLETNLAEEEYKALADKALAGWHYGISSELV